MSEYQLLKTMPGDTQYTLFQGLPIKLYEKTSPRFQLGNDPVLKHLEGCYVLLENKEPLGRVAFYENPGLRYKGLPAACIGSYECVQDNEASNALLDFTKELAKSKSYSWLIGPMEGSTWNNYRFSLHNNAPNFFMEPYHHIYYNIQFEQAGFEKIAHYISNLDHTLHYQEDTLQKFEKHYTAQGAVLRNLHMDDLESELKKIAELSLLGFAENLLYTPIAIEDFVAKYSKLGQFFDPRLIKIAENEQGEMQAFIFGVKDFLDTTGKTLIIKTLMRRQSSPYRGIGSYLAGKLVQTAKELGYKKVIHALMIKGNASVVASKKYEVEEYKSYALYGLQL